ncbi:zona pellucida sperm-binding protein 3-like [Carassius auratus]|uniref:Zona pellucida sperm-binding protein 3 n=1 Tax=Carassius auratus TaxID=7957 RepID=A0A6P6NUI6_CARAU|nr:zona pellucida sperm-binding protein 3-like [Carassius auratus]
MGLLQCLLVLVVLVVFDLKNAIGRLSSSQSPKSKKHQSYPASRVPVSSQVLGNTLQKASLFQSLDYRGFAQEPLGLQEKQVLQGPVKPLDWRFPIVPEVPSEMAVDFHLRQPVTPSSVAIQCGENRIHVEVQQDLFSNGELIQPSGLTLGGCPVVGLVPGSKVLFFENELQDCNSVLMMTKDELVYTFALTYTPEAFAGTPITRAGGAVIGVQCHYQRFQNVSSSALKPTWVPYASTEAGEEVLVFSLKLMTGLCSFSRPSERGFQLEAFMFQGGSSPSIYMTCVLKATLASAPSDALHKSCSFANGWLAADGNNQVCGCCDSTCGPDGGTAASPFGGLRWEGKASLGPVVVQEHKKTLAGLQ